jgi:hypothetical protein
VDAVTEVLRVPNSAIDTPSSMVMQGNADYLRGIAKLADRLIILLDLSKLLSSKADVEEISRVLSESARETAGKTEGEPVAPKNGHNKKKSGDVKNNNNSKEYAVA